MHAAPSPRIARVSGSPTAAASLVRSSAQDRRTSGLFPAPRAGNRTARRPDRLAAYAPRGRPISGGRHDITHSIAREFLRLAGLGGVVFASGLPGCAASARPAAAAGLLVRAALGHPLGLRERRRSTPRQGHASEARRGGERARTTARLRRVHRRPDADDRRSEGAPRAARASFASIAARLRRPRKCTYFAGEHDAALDRGEAYQEVFGGALLHVRPQGRALHRPRQHLRPGAHPRRDADRVAAAPDLGDARPRRSRSSCSPTGRSSRSTRNGTGRRATARPQSSC